ncbi:MAG TPA: outer membrane lipoprotein-sorting protein [Candidatus Limnocylindria bacterium]|nr:outer membrane lipoprotein-sorting protein [Candidatus Limnocylindria bacterium]
MAARFLMALGIVCALAAAGRAADALKPGDTLGPDNWQKAEKLLPPEILAHYKAGEYVNPINDWPENVFTWPTDFAAASKANEGTFTLGAHGEVVEKTTGKQPEWILGFPFPTIDPKDPTAGAKILWNHLYRTWYFGNGYNESQVNWVKPQGLERRIDVLALFNYFDGLPERERPKENPHNFQAQELTVVRSPADVNGTAALTWRYRNPEKRDASWTFVPALRRVRAISPANRSDGFLGSDMCQDDGPFFTGKPEDFTWKLTGEVQQLRLVDPLNLEGKSGNEWLPSGGWRAVWPDMPYIGYMDPNWKGIAWAPRTAGLAERRFYVVEGVPKDRYYLFGKLELYIDAVSFQGAWNRKFDWKGELVNSFQVMAWNPHELKRPDGTSDFVQGSNQAFQTVEAVKLRRATVAGIKSSPKANFDGRITFRQGEFDLDTLSRYGK